MRIRDYPTWPRTASERAVLQIGIGQVAFVDRAIAFNRQREMKLADLPAVWNARDLVNRAVVTRFHFVGIFDDLVDEIAEVQNETELLGGGSAFIFVNHPPIGVERALIDILAAHKCEVHRARIVWRRRCDRAATRLPFPSRSVNRYQ